MWRQHEGLAGCACKTGHSWQQQPGVQLQGGELLNSRKCLQAARMTVWCVCVCVYVYARQGLSAAGGTTTWPSQANVCSPRIVEGGSLIHVMHLPANRIRARWSCRSGSVLLTCTQNSAPCALVPAWPHLCTGVYTQAALGLVCWSVCCVALWGRACGQQCRGNRCDIKVIICDVPV